MDALDGYEADDNGQAWQERGEGEGEVAAGFGSFGGGGGGDGRSGREAPYDGLALDRLMGVMAAARTLKLTRLQVRMGGRAGRNQDNFVTFACCYSTVVNWANRVTCAALFDQYLEGGLYVRADGAGTLSAHVFPAVRGIDCRNLIPLREHQAKHNLERSACGVQSFAICI